MNSLKVLFIILSCFVSILLASCGGVNFADWRFPYMYPVQQGNYINQQQLSVLKVGMTKEQVGSAIGNPVSQFMFESTQWQYNYQEYKNDKLVNSYVININYDNQNLLISVESAGSLFVK